jgi:hypothetical protein
LDISEMKIRRFAIDPLVDLLAIIEERENGWVLARHLFVYSYNNATTSDWRHGKPFRLHLRRLLNGEPHPRAAKHSIDLDMTTSHLNDLDLTIHIQASLVGVLVHHDEHDDEADYLAIWNWQTGNLEMVSTLLKWLIIHFSFQWHISHLSAIGLNSSLLYRRRLCCFWVFCIHWQYLGHAVSWWLVFGTNYLALRKLQSLLYWPLRNSTACR